MRNRSVRDRTGRLLAAALLAAVLAACNSSRLVGQDPAAQVTPAVESSDTSVTVDLPTPGVSSEPATPPVVVEATEDAYAGFAEFDPATVTPAPPAQTPAELIGGAPDPVRAAIVERALRKRGHDLTGLGVHVLPIGGGAASLLVLTLDENAAMAEDEAGSTSDRFAEDLVRAIRKKGVDVSQVAMNFGGTDLRGPYVVTMTFAAADAARILTGDEDSSDALRVQVSRTGGSQ